MQDDPEPRLAPPGAGLPRLELLAGRILLSLRRAFSTREAATARFGAERLRIRRLLDLGDPRLGARRVLIPRLPGMEDSSRHWSVWMTLDHLSIVNRSMARVIDSLTKGRVPEGQASTARVKPSPDATSAARDSYESSCDHLLSTVATAGNLKTALRYTHPWFGPLDAAAWHLLAGEHLAIHRRQLERIVAVIGAQTKRTG